MYLKDYFWFGLNYHLHPLPPGKIFFFGYGLDTIVLYVFTTIVYYIYVVYSTAHRKDISFAMDFPGVDLIEQCHHDKCVEDDGEVLGGRRVEGSVEAAVDAEQWVARKDEREQNGQLVDGMANDVFHHCARNQWTKIFF